MSLASSSLIRAFWVALAAAGWVVGQTTPPFPTNNDPKRQIRFDTPEQAEARRAQLVKFIWDGQLPTTQPTVTIGAPFPSLAMDINPANVARVDRLDVDVSGWDFHSISYLMHPANKSNAHRVVIVHHGHAHDLDAGVGAVANHMLEHGFTVLVMKMPLYGWNTGTTANIPGYGKVTYSPTDHNPLILKTAPANGGLGFRLFLEPVVQNINYVAATIPDFQEVNMIGLSGGGWITSMMAAIDPRIKFSVPVAGSAPLYVRNQDPGSVGDAEQFYAPLYDENIQPDGSGGGVCTWLEVYALGGFGSGRHQVMVTNEFDSCCFSGRRTDTYKNIVAAKVAQLGEGQWEYVRDSTHREHQISSYAISSVIDPLFGIAPSRVCTISPASRPAWIEQDGIVMAGDWEVLPCRVKRDGGRDHTPTPEQRAAYAREHTPEMLAQLKALGVNFIMTHGNKSLGRVAEAECMADTVRFALLCHETGLRVGVYTNSGTITHEEFYQEHPEARDWLILDTTGKPLEYCGLPYRYCWDRNNPAVRDYMHELTRWAVNDVGADLLHFDNYIFGPGYEPLSAQRFRDYLRNTFKPGQCKKLDVPAIDNVKPPRPDGPDNIIRRAWLDFCCQSLADSYLDLNRYARSLRPDVLVELNPMGPGARITSPVDHGRLLAGGEAFWDEGERPGVHDGHLVTRIRTYKVARRMDNIAFTYVLNPLEAAESMAFNRDCLGCIAWFEYAKIAASPFSSEPVSPSLAPYVDFFHRRHDLLKSATVAADVAVLRSFPSQVFAANANADLTARVEQAFIEGRVPFQIIYDAHLAGLKRYRCLVLAGCVAMSEAQLELVRQYVAGGGKLCIIGSAATHDEWLSPREHPAVDDLPAASVLHVAETADPIDSARKACGGKFSMEVQAPFGFCAELTDQPGRRLLHLVDYNPARFDGEVMANIAVPPGRHVKSFALASPDQSAEQPIPFDEQSGRVSFKIKSPSLYEIAIITWE